MKLFRPLKRNLITQRFGLKNTKPHLLAMYQSMRLEGHNGIDYGAVIGEKLYWNCSSAGKITALSNDVRAGLGIVAVSKDGEKKYKHIFWHLSKILCKVGDIVETGDLIGLTGNTGQYSTGPHLHYGLKECDALNQTINWTNGYKGAINPMFFYQNIFVVDYMEALQTQLRLLKKLVKLWQDFIKLKLG